MTFAFLALYFLWFAYDGASVGWTEDDPMNLYFYWKPGFAKVAVSNLTFWTGFYRPLGGFFYLPIYALTGMNATPYRWAGLAILALNTFLVYRLALRLSSSERMAGLAALFACIHGNLADLVYNTSSVYDVLAVTFSLLSLLVYTSKHRFRHALALPLMILAINAKEIAATLPAFFLLYEVLFHPRTLRRNAWWSFAALAFAAGAMYGKMHGPEAMSANPAYHPVFTMERWLDANVSYMGALLYRLSLPAKAAIGIWLGMVAAAALTRNRVMAWGLGVLLLSTIPISFIPKRFGGSLYLPLIGAAIWSAASFDWLISRLPSRFAMRTVATALLVIAFWRWTAHGFQGRGDWWRTTQATPNTVLAKLQKLPYRPAHGKRILFQGSPYKDSFDLVFLANLVWVDRTLEVTDANVTPAADPAQFDTVIAFKGEGLEVVKQ